MQATSTVKIQGGSDISGDYELWKHKKSTVYAVEKSFKN
jgi:hypothetical protein